MPDLRLVPFCKLADPARYVACNWDLTVDEAGRAHWVTFFKRHVNTILKLGIESSSDQADAEKQAAGCRQQFYATFDAFAAEPAKFGRVTILTLDEWRDQTLRRWGFLDPFADLKRRENEKMLPLLPKVRLTLLVGIHAQGHYLRDAAKSTMTETVRGFKAHGPALFPLPHPSWRSTGWMRRNPWFEADVLPVLRKRVRAALAD